MAEWASPLYTYRFHQGEAAMHVVDEYSIVHTCIQAGSDSWATGEWGKALHFAEGM